MKKSSRRGFTLIEIMVAVAIMGILASIGLGSYISSLSKGRDSQRKQDLAQIQKALSAYQNDFQSYPGCSTNLKIVGCGDGTEECDWGDSFSRDIDVGGGETETKTYMSRLPSDPSSDASYVYISDGDQYQLFATLENGNDPDYQSGGYGSLNCGSVDCYYGLPSPNTNLDSVMSTDNCN